MAYRRRRYFRRRRVYRGRRRYAISRYNTFRYRSAKAQANQIYRINKKINTIQKMQKPEIKTWLQNYTFNVGDYCNYSFGSLTKGQNFIFDGRICRMQNINAWFILYMDPGMVGLAPDMVNYTATARVIVYQLKEATTNIISTPSEIFNITGSEESSNVRSVRKQAWMRAIYGPLHEGISSRVKILRDFKITLGPTHHRSAKAVKLKNKQIGNIEKSNLPDSYNKGSIYWLCITSLNTYQIAAEGLHLQVNVKMAYIDES